MNSTITNARWSLEQLRTRTRTSTRKIHGIRVMITTSDELVCNNHVIRLGLGLAEDCLPGLGILAIREEESNHHLSRIQT